MRILINIIWLIDIFNVPGFEALDTTYPLNTGFWIIVWLVLWFMDKD